ncbi:MAG: ferrous iron transport protein A [Candidatus Saccharibacteria bacterium]|nr:ferrous iron transport protein A [Moraxellaceae bacterium]
MRLSDLSKNVTAIILSVEDSHPTDYAEHDAYAGNIDTIAHRLRELGFVPGELVRLITVAPFGGDPILVQIGFTRFALRKSEAKRILVEAQTA